MRKLKLQMHMTLDGYVGGPNGDMDWITWGTEKVFLDYIDSLIDTSDTIVLGRKMTEGFVSYWTKTVADPKDPSYAFAKKMVDTQKVVFTKTLTRSPWANTILATGNLADEIETLRNKNGKDIIVYGGAGLVSSLIQVGLIDEYYLFVNPVAIGKGMAIFKQLENHQNLKLMKAQSFECGLVLLNYKIQHDQKPN